MWVSLSVTPMNNDKKYKIIPYPSEHVIVDGAGNKVVSCPTEQETREYIKEVLEGEAMRTEEPVHNMNKKAVHMRRML